MIKRFIANRNGIAYMRRIYTDLDAVLCVACGAVCFSFITSLLLVDNTVTAVSKTTTASVTVPEACTMTSTTNTPHTAILSPNTYSGASGSEYANGIGKTTLTATCNDDNGFAIYAIGYTGNSYDSENHNKLVGQSTNVAINTAVYTSGDTTSSWSMKVNKINDSTVSYNPQNMSILDSFDSWHIVPATYTKVAEYHANTGSSTTDTTLGAKVETTYAAYIASNQPADTYIGQVKYTMVHPYDEQPLQPQTANSGCINYFPNGSNVEGTMGCQSVGDSDTNITLLASNFSRQGYGFAGWSNKYDYTTNPTQEGIKFYGPQETISFTAGQYTGSNPGLSLYAVWVKSQGSLQDSSKVSTVCSNLTTAPIDGTANLTSVSALTDSRDNQTYAIAKLADNKCWMIENMRLENTATGNSDGSLAQGYGGQFAGLANPETPWANDSTTANSLYSTDGADDTINIGISNASYRFPRYNNQNTSDRASAPATSANTYSYGNYYTWAAVMANTTNLTSSSTSEATNTSLCPKGWTLPTSGSADKDFATLYANLNSTVANIRKYPNNFLYSGVVSGSSVGGRGSSGYCWSKSARSSTNAYTLYFNSSYVYPSSYIHKYTGYSVRCLAQ